MLPAAVGVQPMDSSHISLLPSSVMDTILMKLDVLSLYSVAATCKSLRSSVSTALSFLPSFDLTEIAPTLDVLRSMLLLPNPHLASLKLDCSLLDDSATDCILRPSLEDLCLYNCHGFRGSLLASIGQMCSNLRFLTITSLGEKRGLGQSLFIYDLEQILSGCSQLETLCLAFDLSVLDHPTFGPFLATDTIKLSAFTIGYLPTEMATEMLNLFGEPRHSLNQVKPSMFSNLQMLSLSVDNITDDLVGSISKGLASLTHLSLQDAPLAQPAGNQDLTNTGLQQINFNRKLKEISLIRSQEFSYACFQRVNDLGLLLMSEACSSLESICLGGFCHVTDTGFRAILHSSPRLQKLKVVNGTSLTDLVFHDIAATSLRLTDICLRRCNLLTDLAISRLSMNLNLSFLDLRDCRNIGDRALKVTSSLPKLLTLLLDNTNISDIGLSHVGHCLSPLNSLSLRVCRRLTDQCISSLFAGSLGGSLQILDFSNVHNITDNGILSLVKSGASLKELRLRNCPLIGDTSVMALASMQINGIWQGSSLQLLDLYECRGISQLAFRWFKKPYFPRLRWLGVSGSSNRDLVDALARSRPLLRVACRGEELGSDSLDPYYGCYSPEEEEMDEMEQWLSEAEVAGDAHVIDEE